MPTTDPNEFTDREKFVLSYYRDARLSKSRRLLFYNLVFIVSSIACVVLSMAREDEALAFVAYCLLLGRICYLMTEGGHTTEIIQSILAKYEAKPNALTEAQRQEDSENG